MRLLLDMNLPRDLAGRLETAGHTCRHVSDMGLSEAEDSDILEAARRAGEAILTHDLDFGELLTFRNLTQPSVVVFRMRDVSVTNLARCFIRACPHIEESLRTGAIVVIGDDTVRVRRLPVFP
jgi:predicted nuclease of predicted toxin-antitoxin system